MLETCFNTKVTPEQYEKHIAHVEKYGRDLGLDRMMDEYNLNIIIGPLECDLGNFAASAGRPYSFWFHMSRRVDRRSPQLMLCLLPRIPNRLNASRLP